MRIGLLIIATGKYISFVGQLQASVEKYFFNDKKTKVTLFVFTDSPETPKGTVRLAWLHRKFPLATLLRYHAFTKYARKLSSMDYLFYCDVDMRFVASVGKEILGNLVATLHPGFYTKPREVFTYETRKKSMAYIPKTRGIHYYCGGFQGGKATEYLKLSEILSSNINKDLKNNIIALHNDESHFNAYLTNHNPDIILSPAYCFPEQLTPAYHLKNPTDKKNYYLWFPSTLKEFAQRPKLIALCKDHSVMRYSAFESFWHKTYDSVYKFVFTVISRARQYMSLPSHLYRKLFFEVMKSYPNLLVGTLYSQKFDAVDSINCTVQEIYNKNTMDLVTIGFNNPEVIETQIKLLRKNLRDSYFHTIADNSSDYSKRNQIKNICKKYGIGYIGLPDNIFNNSGLDNLSHGSALTWVYKNYLVPRKPKYFGFLDHDIFPYRKTSLAKYFRLSPMFGIVQPRDGCWYLWAGFCFYDMDYINFSDLNFLSQRYKSQLMDTGGGNWKSLYSGIDVRKLPIFPHRYLNLTGGNIAQHDMVEYFGDWLHLFNASNWYSMSAKKYITRRRKINHLLKKYV